MPYYEDRINELRLLQKGWANGSGANNTKTYGEPINEKAIQVMNEICSKIVFDFDDFKVFPTEDGNLVIENDVWEIEAYANGNTGYLFMTDNKEQSKEDISIKELVEDYLTINL